MGLATTRVIVDAGVAGTAFGEFDPDRLGSAVRNRAKRPEQTVR